MPLRSTPLPENSTEDAERLKNIQEMPAPGSTHFHGSSEKIAPVRDCGEVSAEVRHSVAAIDAARFNRR